MDGSERVRRLSLKIRFSGSSIIKGCCSLITILSHWRADLYARRGSSISRRLPPGSLIKNLSWWKSRSSEKAGSAGMISTPASVNFFFAAIKSSTWNARWFLSGLSSDRSAALVPLATPMWSSHQGSSETQKWPPRGPKLSGFFSGLKPIKSR